MLTRCLVALAFVLAAPAATAERVDLELVLAVDVSRSMDRDEQRLQRDGYVAALTHPAFLAAIGAGETGRVAIAYLEWGGPWSLGLILDWTVLEDEADAREAAARLAAAPIGAAQGTSISGALAAAARLIADNRIEGARRVIDVSGDGPNNVGLGVERARDRALAEGVEINGLAIMIKEGWGGFQIDELDIYYRDCVIGGPRAFVRPVFDKAGFATAIRQKLVLEVAGRQPAPTAIPAAGETDCFIGEKQRREYMRSLGFE